MSVSLIPQLLKAWAAHLPAIIAFIAALIIIMIKWQQTPRASLFAMLGVLLNLAMALVMPAIFVWLPQVVSASEVNRAETLGRLYLVLNVAGSLLYAISFLFVFSAVYMDRHKDQPPPRR